MKIRLVDYIAEFLADNGITHVFTVTGGGAMWLNDAFGKNKRLHCIYDHHEQACAIAGECYPRVYNKLAAVCVTTGPGGTNAITGVVGAWVDSIPMLIFSGQAKYPTTARSTGLPLRAMGDQEFDITKAISCMTKHSAMVIDPKTIRYHLEKSLFLAKSGRPGPCWLDIPGDVQSATIETDELIGYDPAEDAADVPPVPDDKTIDLILEKIKKAERPVIYAGNGIVGSGAHEEFLALVDKLNIPVVTSWNGLDEIYDAHPRYVGRAGMIGNRPGNWAIQNSDLLIVLACRLNIREIGFNFDSFARFAEIIMVDADEAEMKKPTIKIDMPIRANVADVIRKLYERGTAPVFNKQSWLDHCTMWKEKYPVVKEEHCTATGLVNPYCFFKELSSRLPENYITVSGNGTPCVMGAQSFIIKKGGRYIFNSGMAAMGYDLPAAIGACVANNSEEIILLTGDGSIQMNIQELQTIVQNKLPIKIFLINNMGYHSIRQSQKSFFGEPCVGIGPDSGDLSFPDMEKLAYAYGIPYMNCRENKKIVECIEKVLAAEGNIICEIFVTIEQGFDPRSSTKRLADGSLWSAPLEDMAPFLPREELKSVMLVPLMEEK